MLTVILISVFVGCCVGFGYGWLFNQRMTLFIIKPGQQEDGVKNGAGRYGALFLSFIISYGLLVALFVLLMKTHYLNLPACAVGFGVGFGFMVWRHTRTLL